MKNYRIVILILILWFQTIRAEEPVLETIAILGTNDLHGALFPSPTWTRETQAHIKPIAYSVGGLTVFASYFSILKKQWKDRLLWVDAGDQFQGTLESNLSYGEPMVLFFNHLGLGAAAIGNHEFDFGVPILKSRIEEARYPYLAANLLNQKDKNLVSWSNVAPSILLQAGRLKVGVIGLTTRETPQTTQTEYVKHLIFSDLKEATLKQSKWLREQGAHIVILNAHLGLRCIPSLEDMNYQIYSNKNYPKNCKNPLGLKDELVELLEGLPQGTLDAVNSGHTHQFIHHWISDVPVIQSGAFGKYFHLIHLTYDWSQKKLRSEQSKIEGPIQICHQFFKNQQNCQGDSPAPHQGRGPLVPANFQGYLVQEDPEVVRLFEKATKKAKSMRRKVLGKTLQLIDHRRMEESALGNLVVDAMRVETQSDFAYLNAEGIRAPIELGQITYGDVFRAFPFDNTLVVLQLTKKELVRFFQVAYNGVKGFGSVSGLKLTLLHPSLEAPFVDFNGNSEPSLWKRNRLVDLRSSQGEALNPEKLYTLVTVDFIVNGGDHLAWPMSQIPAHYSRRWTGILVRDLLVKTVIQKKIIDQSKVPLVNPKKPRLQWVYSFEKLMK